MINNCKKAAGSPPKFESILTPSIPPAKQIMIQDTVPTVTPQIIFSHGLPSGLSGEIPVEEMLDMADIFESEEVTKQTNALNK